MPTVTRYVPTNADSCVYTEEQESFLDEVLAYKDEILDDEDFAFEDESDASYLYCNCDCGCGRDYEDGPFYDEVPDSDPRTDEEKLADHLHYQRELAEEEDRARLELRLGLHPVDFTIHDVIQAIRMREMPF